MHRTPKQPNVKTETTHASSLLLRLKEGGWGIYFQQRLWPAALALALLYLTVLSLGLLMTAYLKWQGMTEAELSLYRGAGAVSGLLSTVVFPTIHKRTGASAEPCYCPALLNRNAMVVAWTARCCNSIQHLFHSTAGCFVLRCQVPETSPACYGCGSHPHCCTSHMPCKLLPHSSCALECYSHGDSESQAAGWVVRQYPGQPGIILGFSTN